VETAGRIAAVSNNMKNRSVFPLPSKMKVLTVVAKYHGSGR
jgi:hypothetical protein